MVGRVSFSDEELVAYLDGESEFVEVEAIENALAEDPTLRERLDRLRVDTALIVNSFEGLTNPQKALPDLPLQKSWVSSMRMSAAAALVAVLIGFAGGYVFPKNDQSDWIGYVAAYQALYTNSTLSHVVASEAVQRDELDRVGNAIGKRIDIANLKVFPEVDYKRAQILGFQGQALAQLAFLASTGDPLALCIIRTSEADSDQITMKTREDMSSASWVRDGYAYVLIGGKDDVLISRLAVEFSKRRI